MCIYHRCIVRSMYINLYIYRTRISLAFSHPFFITCRTFTALRAVAGEGPRDPGALRAAALHGPAGDFCAPPATWTHNGGLGFCWGNTVWFYWGL